MDRRKFLQKYLHGRAGTMAGMILATIFAAFLNQSKGATGESDIEKNYKELFEKSKQAVSAAFGLSVDSGKSKVKEMYDVVRPVTTIADDAFDKLVALQKLQEDLCREEIYSNPAESERVNKEIKTLEENIEKLYEEWEEMSS